MSDLTVEQLIELTSETLAWANDLSEQWTGTMWERLITMKSDQLRSTMSQDAVYDLAQTLEAAELAYQN